MSVFGNIVSKVGSFYMAHSTVINTSGIIIGVGASAIVTGKASIKASKILEEYKKEENIEKVPAKVVVKKTWKTFIPSALVISSTIALTILNSAQASHKIMALTSKIAGLAGICANKDTLLENYKRAAKEVLKDDKKIKEIEKEANKKNDKQLVNAKESELKKIKLNNDSEFICIDSFSGRPFAISNDKIEKIEALIQKDILINDSVTLNELWTLLGLDATSIGDDFIWGYNSEFYLRYDSSIREGKPVGVLKYPMPESLPF